MKLFILILLSVVFFSCVSTIPHQETVPTGLTDIANMFNERGFYKSNGFSFDEQEIINDFNGNLMFEKPLYNFALAGDVNLNLSLNYNGSVGHQFFLGDTSSYNTDPDPRRYNLNVAEWIISLNGIAIQALNFETNFLTDPQINTITGDSVRLLIPGYHFDGPLLPPMLNAPNTIMILAGDGSVITLENKSSDESYIGTYAYDGKDLHYKGQVSYIEGGSDGFRRRKLELMKGDGSIYEFIEYKRNFVDFLVNSFVNIRRRPMMFLLEKIKDEFGHVISITYNMNIPTSNPTYGRPIIDSIKAIGYSKDPILIHFALGAAVSSSTMEIYNTSQVNGNYKFFYKTPVTLFSQSQSPYNVRNHKAYIDKIRNPLNQFDTLQYESYIRRFNNLPTTSTSVGVIDTLNRITYFKNTLKKRTDYVYMLPRDIQVTYNVNNIKLISQYSHGYGRDQFYTNMLSLKTDYDNLIQTSRNTLEYLPTSSNQDKIDTNVIYETTRGNISLNSSTVNYSQGSVYQKKSYKTYPIDSKFNNYLEVPDIQGTVKLISDFTYYPETPQISIDQNIYDFERGNYTGSFFTGSFLMLSKLNYRNNLPRLWTYSYTYKDENYDSVLTSSKETDPLLNGSRTIYYNFYKTGLIHKRMSDYLNEVNSVAFNDTSIYYKIQFPKTEERMNQNSQVISSVSYEYIIDTSDANGYYGQLRNKKQNNSISQNEFILTEFEYYKNDYEGNTVYSGNFYPYKEGNIKVTRNPNGEVTKYFYNPITPNEVDQRPENPELLFYLKYNNNTTVQTSEDIWDGRFPIRTDSYKENGVTTDTLSISYKSYAVDGSPSKIISRNKYTSNIEYEPVHRVSSITLPGDFTTDSSTYTIKYNYDNVNNFIYTLSYRNTLNNQYSKVKYSIDGFGNVKQKDVFTSDTDSNSFKYSFNYMNKPADNTDAMGNTTELSYDGLGHLIRTNNADGSQTFNSYTYQNTLGNYFGGTYNGFIEKQVYTDEEAHHFEKYFDAVGNLLQELSYTYEIPSVIKTGEPDVVLLITNYQYDSLYRLTKVQTPEGKFIYYAYDGFGRQSQRTTPDAGLTTYTYDKNSNLTFSQDANQRYADANKNTFRNYDGINRLTGVGENVFIPDSPTDGEQFVPAEPDLYLTVNVYDTLSSSVVNNLFFPPPDYYTNVNNFTKGNIAATAYRTRITDNWSYKYYRYDERGRVIRIWNTIYGEAGKNIIYEYNSQDQVTHINYGDEPEYKRFSYYYDYAGRLGTLNYANADPSIVRDKSAPDINFSSYTYNPNSLLDFQFFNSSRLHNQYRYNSRNWITEINSVEGVFGFTNTYFKNGNLNTQLLTGTYKDYMQNRYNLNYKFSYDYCNRLLNAQNINQGDNTYSVFNTYDKDGNLTTLKRYGDNNILADNFIYTYSPGTNKLTRVSGATDQFSHDLNGNTILDELNGNYNILYDHRNLITEFYRKFPNIETPYTTATRYYYDETGNRVRKLTYYNTQYDPLPVIDWNNLKNPGNNWQLLNNEFYEKGADGKDLATYEGQQLQEWYVWGNDIAGKLKGDKAYYYYKDHLGSVRAVVDNTGAIVAGFDYDAWGYPLENRNYNGDSIKYKYTGKELDKESFYDYFGARYYDARIGRWGTTDPLLEKHFNFNPYNFVLNNPLYYFDPDGRQIAARDKNDPGVDFPIQPPNTIGVGIAKAISELVKFAFQNPSTIYGIYKTLSLYNETIRLQYEYENSPYITEEIQVNTNMSENKNSEIDQSKTADELIPSRGKKSKSYRGELGEKTYEEIIKKSKDKNDPQQQAAKQMKKLIEQSERYLEKERQKGRQ